ncbi:MAG TPA: sn-glycerol-3-phosphate ABC transporter ATP-binding protein UgpC [Acholeplasmataceae bacterium]|nr:sn-glycerol-3-phosphate ABC transporter ATP-binding protein UgpC [Acholeplasmataceae bacterium]
MQNNLKQNLIEIEAGDLVFENVGKIYPNGVVAVKDFNLEVKPSELVVLVGPSGCGKSTTIRMIAGLEEITTGKLSSNGKVLNNEAPKDRDIAMVFQNYALYAHMTVYHNMAFSLMIRKENEDLIHEKVMRAAKTLGLEPYLNRKPAHLSGGQRQRVAIGRAIVRSPKVFLLDEPLSNLDAKLRNQMRKELKLLQKSLNATMIYVTHDQIEAVTLADRIVIMNKGYIQQVGTPVEVYTDPANLFVANFIGTPPMNVFKVKVNDKGEIILIDNNDESLQTKINIKEHPAYENIINNYLGKKVYLGIRPEDIKVRRLKDSKSIQQSVIINYELLGSESLIHMLINNKHVIAKIKDEERLNVEDKIEFKFSVENIYLFDEESEMRIR